MKPGRIPNAVHEAGPWRIRALVEDFELEDVWALPVRGRADEFDQALEAMTTSDPTHQLPFAARTLWVVRDLLGRAFRLGRVSRSDAGDEHRPIPHSEETSLVTRLPADLRGTVGGLAFGSLPFSPLFRTSDEFAAELSNATVHAVMHLAWVPSDRDEHQAQMAVYVKPRGLFGRAYMAFIKPFRYLIVYPAILKVMERRWADRPGR